MSSQRRIVLRPVALLLVFAVLQVYVLVSPAKASGVTNATTSTNSAPGNLLFGQLLTSENQSALLNGISATSGTTIFSGAQLQTPEGVAATVQLGTLGDLAIDPNTLLSLTFGKDFVDVRVTAGNAILTTNQGVTGTLTTPDGQKLLTNSATRATVGRRAAAAKLGGNGNGLGLLLTAALITAAIIVFSRGDNDNQSPSNP